MANLVDACWYADYILSSPEVSALVSDLGLVPGSVPPDFIPPYGRRSPMRFCEAWKKHRRAMDVELIRFQNDFYRRNHYKYAVRKSYICSCKESSTKFERRNYFSSLREMPSLFETETA